MGNSVVAEVAVKKWLILLTSDFVYFSQRKKKKEAISDTFPQECSVNNAAFLWKRVSN